MRGETAARALVLGAGISGLAAARRLRRQGFSVIVLEAGRVAGGLMRTAEVAGCRFELGPSTVKRSPELEALCRDAGCGERLETVAPAAGKRYVLLRGELVALPASPPAWLTTPLLGARGRLRLLTEPLRRRGPGPQEALADFVRRRLGPEAVPLVDAVALGVFAGDPGELAVGWAFPEIYRLERDHGSLIRGLLELRRSNTAGRPTVVGYQGGFSALAADLAQGLDVRYGTAVRRVMRCGDGFAVEADGAAGASRFEARRLISALPAAPSLGVLAGLGDLRPLAALPHAAVAVLNLVLPRAAVRHPLDGFGCLVPHGENLPILGCLFVSSLLPDAAPEDRVALTVMIGGRRRPALVDEDDDRLRALALDALRRPLGITGPPLGCRLTRWPAAIPQPTADWPALQAAADAVEASHPGLRLLGSWRSGPGVPSCVRGGWSVA